MPSTDVPVVHRSDVVVVGRGPGNGPEIPVIEIAHAYEHVDRLATEGLAG